jgi:hypothetical protein
MFIFSITISRGTLGFRGTPVEKTWPKVLLALLINAQICVNKIYPITGNSIQTEGSWHGYQSTDWLINQH